MSHDLQSQHQKIKFSISLNKIVLLVCLLVAAYFGYEKYSSYKVEQAETSIFIVEPKVDDIYFLDLSLLSDNSKDKNHYQLAQVIAVRGSSVTIVYGKFFYQWQYSVVNSIQYGDLRNNAYFGRKLEILSFDKIKEMEKNGTIYLVKRPIRNKLYGNYVSRE